MAIAGLWWFCLALFTFAWLRPRPAPPLPENTTYVGQSFARLKRTFARVRRLKNTFLFLCSFWLFSDGISTLTFASSLVAAQAPLFFTSTQLGLLLLEVNLTALLGNLLYEQLAQYLVSRWKKTKSSSENEEIDTYWVFFCFLSIFFWQKY